MRKNDEVQKAETRLYYGTNQEPIATRQLQPHNQTGSADPSYCVARLSLTVLGEWSSIPDAGILVTKSDWPTLVGSVC